MHKRFHSSNTRIFSLFGVFFCLLGGAFLIFIGHGFPPTSWILLLQALPQLSHLLTLHNSTIPLLLILLVAQALLILTAWIALSYTLITLLLFLLTSSREVFLPISDVDKFPHEVDLQPAPLIKQEAMHKSLITRPLKKQNVETTIPSSTKEVPDASVIRPQSSESNSTFLQDVQTSIAGNDASQEQSSIANPFESEPSPPTLVKSTFTPETKAPDPAIKPTPRVAFAPLLVGARSSKNEKVPGAPRAERVYCQQWTLPGKDHSTYYGIFLLLDCHFTNPANYAFSPVDPQLAFWQQELCNTMLNSLICNLIPALFTISQPREMEDFFSQTVARIIAETKIAYPWRQIPSLIAVLRFAETLSVINIGKGSCYLIETNNLPEHTEDDFQYNTNELTGRVRVKKLIVSSKPVALSISNSETLLCCSEGLSNVIAEQQRIQIVHTHREDPALAAQEIIEQAFLNHTDISLSMIILHGTYEVADTNQKQRK